MSQTCQTAALVFEAIPARDTVDEWIVEAVDHASEGEVYVARFSGPGSKTRAIEYADWMNHRQRN